MEMERYRLRREAVKRTPEIERMPTDIKLRAHPPESLFHVVLVEPEILEHRRGRPYLCRHLQSTSSGRSSGFRQTNTGSPRGPRLLAAGRPRRHDDFKTFQSDRQRSGSLLYRQCLA